MVSPGPVAGAAGGIQRLQGAGAGLALLQRRPACLEQLEAERLALAAPQQQAQLGQEEAP